MYFHYFLFFRPKFIQVVASAFLLKSHGDFTSFCAGWSDESRGLSASWMRVLQTQKSERSLLSHCRFRIFWVEIYNSKLLQSWCLDNSTWCLDLMKIRWTWRAAIWELGGKRSHHGTLLMWTRMKTCEDYRGMMHSTIDDTWQPVVFDVFEEAQRRVGEWAFGYVCPFAANACTCTAPKDTLAPKLSFAFDAASCCSLPQELTFHPRWCSAPAFSKSKAIIGMFFQAWSFSKAGLTSSNYTGCRAKDISPTGD